jgi:hypothetical protein
MQATWVTSVMVSKSPRLSETQGFCFVLFCFVLFCFRRGGTKVSIQDFALAKQALYCLSHTSSPFCSDWFGVGGGL